MKKTVLAVSDLVKVFPGSWQWKAMKRGKSVMAVKGLSFEIKEGEILGLLGPNGAGKTTTIEMLLGSTTKTSGSIHYFGQSIDDHRSEVLEQVSYASAYTRLPWQLTVFENLMVFAKMYNVPNPEARIQKLLAEFKMEKFANKRMGSLSAGQTTRVIMAKAFVNYPKLILLDEPTASLDPDSARTVRRFLLKQQRKYKVAMLFTSHNMAEVSEVCDRVIFINHGTITAEDTPEGLAHSVTDCRLQLLVPPLSEAQVADISGLVKKVTYKGSQLEITLPESEISSLLKHLSVLKVDYSQISIAKPTLEDYFLAKSREKQS